MSQASQNSDLFAEQAASQLRKDVAEIDNALEEFLAMRCAATKMQDDAFDAYEINMRELEEAENYEEELLAPQPAAADHNVLRTVNSLRNGGSILDGFEMFESMEGDDMNREHSYHEERSALEFKPVTKKKPVPSADEKNSLRDEMFSFLDSFRVEEQALEEEWEKLRDGGGKAADNALEVLYNTQRTNAIKLKEFIDEYQPVPFSKPWGSDPEYTKISSALKAALIDPSVNVRKLIRMEAGITKKSKKSSTKKSKKARKVTIAADN